MLGPSWILCGLLLCLIEPSLQKGVPPRANGGLGQMMLPAMMRGAGTQPGRGVGPMVSKGIGPRMMLNGYGMARGQQLAAGAMGNGGKAPKPQGYRSSDGFPRGPLPMGVPAGLGMKRKPGYGVPRNGYPTVYQNGYRNGQAGQRLAFRGKQGKVPGYTNGVGSRTAPAMVQPAYANGYRNGYINGYGPGYGNGVPNGYAGSTGYTNGAGLQPGAGGKGLGPTGYGGAAGLTNGYGGAAGLTNGAALQPGAGGKGLGPTGYGGTAGLPNGYGGAAGLTNGAGLQPGAGGKGLGPTGYGAGSIPSAVAYPGIQMAAGYGNGYPSVLADGMAYGLKPGKQLGQDLYGAQHLQANGQSVDATAAKYGTGLPYNGQPFIPAGLGPLTYEIPQQAVRMVPDPAAVKYANGFLGTGLPQAMPAGGNGQYGLGPGPAQQLGAKDGKYAGNGYYGNGYGGCPSGKCNRQGKK